MWKVARRPRWIAALILALAVAGGFAALGQWQLERGIASGVVVERVTETAVPLEETAEPQQPVSEAANGQLVEAAGSFVPGDFVVLSERLNRGDSGYWVVGHFSTSGGTDDSGSTDAAGLAVAVGWAATESEALDALNRLDRESPVRASITGRYLVGEPPQETDFENGEATVLSPAALVNQWNTVDDAGVYGGYLVSADAPASLTTIDSPAPIPTAELNWLNIFYAAEWVVFAGFAVFLWYRLVKDAWERELDEAAR